MRLTVAVQLALATGMREPRDPVEAHFLAVWHGHAYPRTADERIHAVVWPC